MAAGVEPAERGRIDVNEYFQTSVDHIYAVGDVIGFPALAATSMEQGRRATYHAFGEPVGGKLGDLQPIGIYTIPEISYVGRTEDQLTSENVPFEVGVARYRELARGAILGDSYGIAQAAGACRVPTSCSGCTSSARMRPSWCTSARR